MLVVAHSFVEAVDKVGVGNSFGSVQWVVVVVKKGI